MDTQKMETQPDKVEEQKKIPDYHLMADNFADDVERVWFKLHRRLTIVILNWNGEELLNEYLPSVLGFSPRMLCKIMVADNGSTDDSVELLKTKIPRVEILELDKNYGFAQGYNIAMQKVTTPYAVILNNDVRVGRGWIDSPLALLEANPNLACVQPKIRADDKTMHYEYAGAAGGFMDRYGYLFCQGRIFDTVEVDTLKYREITDLLWASGACLFIRTAVFKKEGGFDPKFFAHQEEVDLCWRLRSRGYRILFTPHSTIYHRGGGTLNSSNPQKTFLNFRNNLLMIYKNTPDRQLRRIMFARFWLDRLAALKCYLAGNTQEAQAIMRARRDYKRLKNIYLIAREVNMGKITVKNIPEIMPGSILWKYYIRRKKYFRDLKFKPVPLYAPPIIIPYSPHVFQGPS